MKRKSKIIDKEPSKLKHIQIINLSKENKTVKEKLEIDFDFVSDSDFDFDFSKSKTKFQSKNKHNNSSKSKSISKSIINCKENLNPNLISDNKLLSKIKQNVIRKAKSLSRILKHTFSNNYYEEFNTICNKCKECNETETVAKNFKYFSNREFKSNSLNYLNNLNNNNSYIDINDCNKEYSKSICIQSNKQLISPKVITKSLSTNNYQGKIKESKLEQEKTETNIELFDRIFYDYDDYMKKKKYNNILDDDWYNQYLANKYDSFLTPNQSPNNSLLITASNNNYNNYNFDSNLTNTNLCIDTNINLNVNGDKVNNLYTEERINQIENSKLKLYTSYQELVKINSDRERSFEIDLQNALINKEQEIIRIYENIELLKEKEINKLKEEMKMVCKEQSNKINEAVYQNNVSVKVVIFVILI